MDPAFSLADELAGISDDYSHSDVHHHNRPASLGDEFDHVYDHEHEAEYFDANTRRLNNDGGVGDLASELQGMLGDEDSLGVDVGHHHTREYTSSLADELDNYEDPHHRYHTMARTTSQASSSGSAAHVSASSLNPLASETDRESVSARISGASSPSSRAKSSLSRASGFSSPLTRSSSSFLSSTPSMSGMVRTTDVTESLRSTENFLRQLVSLSYSAPSSKGKESIQESEYEPDTAGLESLASRFLKVVYQCTLEREAQTRELRDLARQASSLPADVRGFRLSSSSSYGSDLADVSSSAAAISSQNANLFDLEEEEQYEQEDLDYDAEISFDDEASLDTFSKASSSPSPSRRRKQSYRSHRSMASISSDVTVTSHRGKSLTVPSSGDQGTLDPTFFSELHASTQSLLISLTSLHESSQIAKSSITDASRKLKSARNVLAQLRQEEDSVEKSEHWIALHGAQAPASLDESDSHNDGDTRSPMSVKAWTEEQLSFCRSRLDDVDSRARSLLTPVSLIG